MKLLALVFLLLASSAFAQRNIFDLMYLPEAGTFFGASALSLTNGKIRGSDVTLTQDGYKISQGLGYSLTSKFSLEASMNRLYSKNIYRYSAPSPSDATYEKGFSDPSLNAKYRIIENQFLVDLLGGVVVGTGNSHIENNRKKNNKQGGSSYKLGLQLGQKTNSFQWSFLALIERFAKSHLTESKSIYGNSSDDPRSAYVLRADILKSMTEKSYIRFFVLSRITDGYTSNNDIHYDATTFFELGPEYQYLFSKDFLAKAGISYSTITNSPSSYDLWNLSLSATYQF